MLTESAIFYLGITRKWANFLAIVMFVMIGLMALAGIFMGFALSAANSMAANSPMPLPAGFFTFFYLLMAAVYFFPALYLYRFAQHLGIALTTGSSEELSQSFLFLKRHYHFIGILLIIGLIFMGLAFLFAIVAGISGFMGT